MNDYPIVTDENEVPRAPVPPSLVTVTRVVYALHALSILIGVFTGASIATAFGRFARSGTRCCGSSLFGSSGLRLPYS